MLRFLVEISDSGHQYLDTVHRKERVDAGC